MNKITISNKFFWGEKIFENKNNEEEYYIYSLNPIYEDKYLIIKNINNQIKYFVTKGFNKICDIINVLKKYPKTSLLKKDIEQDISLLKQKENNISGLLKKYYKVNYSKFMILGIDFKSFISIGNNKEIRTSFI